MTLEAAVSSAVAGYLGGLSGLANVQVSPANADVQESVPRVTVEATREASVLSPYALYRVRVEIQITANAWAGANALDATSGNAEIETLFLAVSQGMAADLTLLSNASVQIFGAVFDGGVTDTRENRTITRGYSLTLMAAPMTAS